MSHCAELGVVRATAEDVTIEHTFFRRVEKRRAVAFDDWTIDGLPLRDLVAGLGNRPPLTTALTLHSLPRACVR